MCSGWYKPSPCITGKCHVAITEGCAVIEVGVPYRIKKVKRMEGFGTHYNCSPLLGEFNKQMGLPSLTAVMA